jgi:hypothetical protein
MTPRITMARRGPRHAVFRSNGSEWWIAFALAFLGKAAVELQEYGRAQACLSEGLAIYRRSIATYREIGQEVFAGRVEAESAGRTL